MKNNYDGIKGWLNYVRDYKTNKEELGEDLKESEYLNKIKKLESNYKEQSKLLSLRNKHIESLNEQIITERRRADELRRNLAVQGKENEKLREKLEKTEKARRKNAGAIGGLKAKINDLTEELLKANYTINFYKKNQKEPSVEEIKAYTFNRKEVLKKIKNK